MHVHARARVDAEEVVLVVHPSELLLQDEQGLAAHGGDGEVWRK